MSNLATIPHRDFERGDKIYLPAQPITVEQIAELLAYIATVDNRHVTPETIEVWEDLLTGIDIDIHEYRDAVRHELRHSTQYLTPARIIEAVRRTSVLNGQLNPYNARTGSASPTIEQIVALHQRGYTIPDDVMAAFREQAIAMRDGKGPFGIPSSALAVFGLE